MANISRREGWFLLGITLLAAILRFIKMDASSLWLDELTTYSITRVHPFNEFIKFYFTADKNPPLFAFLQYPFAQVLPQTEFGVRFFAGLMGTLCVPAIYILGRMFSVRVAMLSAAFMTISYLGIYFSQEARTYSLMIFLCIVTCYYWLRICYYEFSKWDLLLYVLSAVALFYSHYYGILFVATQGLLACFYVKRIGWKNLIFIGVSIVLLSSPWFFILLNTIQLKTYAYGRPTWINILGYHRYLYEKTAVLSIVGTGLIAAAWYMKRKRKESFEKELMLTLFGVIPFVIAFLKSRYHWPVLYERCMLIALPSVMVVTAAAVEDVAKRMKNPNRVFWGLTIFLLVVGVHNTFIRSKVYSPFNKDLNREASQLAEEWQQKYNLPLLIMTKNSVIAAYYLKPETKFEFVPYLTEKPLAQYLSEVKHNEFIYFSYTLDILEAEFVSYLKESFEVVERQFTPRTNYIYLLRRKVPL